MERINRDGDVPDRPQFDHYCASLDCFKAPAKFPGGLVAVECTARDLNKAFHTGNPIEFSTDSNEVIRSQSQLCDHRQIDCQERLSDGNKANTQWNAIARLMVHQESHETENTACSHMDDQRTIDNSVDILDEPFKYIKSADAGIVPASKDVAACRAVNPSPPLTFAFVRGVTPPQVGADHKDVFIYFDVNGQLFIEKGKIEPVPIRDHLNAHDPNAHDFAGVKEMPVTQITETRDALGVTFDCTDTTTSAIPSGFASWDDCSGQTSSANSPAVTNMLDDELPNIGILLKPGRNQFNVKINNNSQKAYL